jgi:hypothetical protein
MAVTVMMAVEVTAKTEKAATVMTEKVVADGISEGTLVRK